MGGAGCQRSQVFFLSTLGWREDRREVGKDQQRSTVAPCFPHTDLFWFQFCTRVLGAYLFDTHPHQQNQCVRLDSCLWVGNIHVSGFYRQEFLHAVFNRVIAPWEPETQPISLNWQIVNNCIWAELCALNWSDRFGRQIHPHLLLKQALLLLCDTFYSIIK